MTHDTLHGLFAKVAAEQPDRTLLTFLEPERTFTAEALYEAARRCAGTLQDAGVRPGDRVALLVDNRPEFMVLWLGCAVAGAVSVPLNTALRGDILSYMLAQTEPVLVATEVATIDDLRQALPDHLRPRVITVGGTERLGDLLAAAAPADPVPAAHRDLASIMYTSGTTGPSKGVMCSHRMLLGYAESALEVLGHGPEDVAYTCLPLFHANALYTTVVASVLGGGRAVISPRFSASEFWAQVVRTEATIVNMLGSMPPILWRQEPSAAEQAHRVRIGLVIPSPVDHHDEFEQRFGFTISELYGLTDFGIPLGIPHGEHRPGSCGKPLPGWRCEVVDEHDQVVPPGEVGELILRPERPYLGSLGYWRMPEATVEAWRNLWFHTGDLVRRDADGWFSFVDRDKDAIRRSGENVSSFEVEQIILTHPDVEDVAVYAVPSEFAEDEVMAAVVCREAARLEPKELVAYCDARLPYFAVPRYIDFMNELPRTQTAKIRKGQLRERGITADTWDAGPRGRKAQQRESRRAARTPERWPG
ncbi:MAG: AMP-binding protein [Propionibacteriales bacterium]|nr:AMP-binding protein [Propionibacteriales bacterium]